MHNSRKAYLGLLALGLCLSPVAFAHEVSPPETKDVIIELVMRWMHILPAIILVGGSFFMWAVLNPSLREALDEGTQLKMRMAIVKRWKSILATCIMLFLLSGFYNYLMITRFEHADNPKYHMVFAIKFLLAMVVFFLAIGMTSTKNWSATFRKNAPFWARVIVMLAIWIVLMAGYMKVMGN